jgi:hypothetical protein
MKRIIGIVLLGCFFLSLLFSEEKETPLNGNNTPSKEVIFGYFNFGISAFVLAPVPLPNIGFGWRHHKDRFGFDISLQAYPYIFINAFSLIPSINYYTKKDFYAGLGAGAGLMFSNEGIWLPHNELLFLPRLTLGKEFITKSNKRRFLQLNVTCPAGRAISPFTFTFISIQYGIGF